MENVIRGNERILVLVWKIGEFFWREDQNSKIEDLVAKLSHVTPSMKRLVLFVNMVVQGKLL